MIGHSDLLLIFVIPFCRSLYGYLYLLVSLVAFGIDTNVDVDADADVDLGFNSAVTSSFTCLVKAKTYARFEF